MQPNITLRYFDIRGLAEPIRLALSYLNIDYEEVKYARCAPDCKDGLTDWTEACCCFVGVERERY